MAAYFHRLVRWFWYPPVLNDAEQNQSAQVLFWILRSSPIVLVIVLLIGVLYPDVMVRQLVVAGILVGLVASVESIVRRGRTRVASIVIVLSGFILVSAGAFISGGIKSPVFPGYAGVIMTSAILYGRRGAFGSLGAVVLLGVLATLGDQFQLFQVPPSNHTSIEYLLLASSTLLFIVVLQNIFSRTLTRTVEELSDELKSRKRAETEMGRSRAILSSVLDSTPDLIVAMDQHHRVIAVNKPLTRMVRSLMGFEPSVGMHMDRIIPEHRQQETFEIYERVFRGEHIRIETHLSMPDGGILYLDESFMPIVGPDGSVQGISAFSRDITDRRAIEIALRASEERYRNIVEQATILVAEVAPNGKYVYVNEAYRSILNYAPEDLLGKSYLEFIHPDDQTKARESRRTTVVIRVRSADGTYRWVEGTGQSLRMSDGEERLVFIGSDVSDRVSAEATKRLLEEQLLQSQKLEAIGTLAGGIAHDFNNILVSLLGNAELARLKTPPDHPTQKYLARLLDGAERARGLVQQILSFSRQKGESERKPLRMSAIGEEALKLMRASIPATVQITVDWLEQGSYIHADPTQIHQVIVNLCTNAAHAMEPGGGSLTIRERIETIADGEHRFSPDVVVGRTYVVLSISDTGSGISPVILPRIFEPFFTTKAPGKGTGLGLSVVHGIIRRHDGTIRVHSVPGEGTTFDVYLPRYEGLVVEGDGTQHPACAAEGERLLLVDDQKEMLDTVTDILEDLGYRVTPRSDPMAALEAFRLDPGGYNLVITDLTMPHMTGIDLARAIHEERPEIPIILATGYQQIDDPEPLKKLGIREIVPKPFRVESIAELLRSILRESANRS